MVGAAERLGISRPAVAKRIANLEALAGCQLLHRGGRGVRLTDAGATLIARARRMLEERDQLLAVLSELRGEGQSSISGLRDLLGQSASASEAAQLPETRLAETERVLQLVLRSSNAGVIISDLDSAVVYEVNEAFCRIVGRTREELLSRAATDFREWYLSPNRQRMLDDLRRDGSAEGVIVDFARPDGSRRVCEATSHLISLAGKRVLLATVEDITERAASPAR